MDFKLKFTSGKPKLEQFLKFNGSLFRRSGAATEKDLASYDCRLTLLWFSRIMQ